MRRKWKPGSRFFSLFFERGSVEWHTLETAAGAATTGRTWSGARCDSAPGDPAPIYARKAPTNCSPGALFFQSEARDPRGKVRRPVNTARSMNRARDRSVPGTRPTPPSSGCHHPSPSPKRGKGQRFPLRSLSFPIALSLAASRNLQPTDDQASQRSPRAIY